MSRNKLQLPALSLIREIYRLCAERDRSADIDTIWERVGAFWGVTGKNVQAWYSLAKRKELH